MLQFVRVTTEDACVRVWELVREAYEEYKWIPGQSGALKEKAADVAEQMKQGEHIYLVRRDYEDVATIRFGLKNGSIYFYRLAVRPRARGNGYAKQILGWLESQARELGIYRIYCESRSEIERNMHLYLSFGYIPFDEEKLIRDNGDIVYHTFLEKQL